LEAVRRVLDSRWIVQGIEVETFENEIAKLHDTRYCIAVSSGTAALHICYLALGIGPGDAVFIPSFAWPSAANMARLVGAQPVFVDVLRDSYNIDYDDLTRRIEGCLNTAQYRPRAIVPVHEFGLAADMDKILEIAARYSLEVIEDAACALGAAWGNKPVGNFGKLGIFSFHPRKSITTGEGGAIVTSDADLAEQCRCWRNHGQRQVNGKRDFLLPGLNYRMTEMQAAIGRVQLAKFPGILQKRRSLVHEYLEKLKNQPPLKAPGSSSEHTWQTFMAVIDEQYDRTQVIVKHAQKVIEVGPGSVAAHLGSYFQPQPALPVSELLHHRGLALPLHAGLSSGHIEQIVEAIRECLDQLGTQSPLTTHPASALAPRAQ
jgi:dTDP-4-amino-4,6-dideoxygalactose transaminase